MRIIETAAKLIKNDIKSVIQSADYYPTSAEMSAENAIDFLLESLCTLLQIFIPSSRVASLGKAIMQATRPRVLLCPLQLGLLGLGVQLHHNFSSRFLNDSLNTYGFCCSYSEVQCFERNASVCQGTDIPNLTPDQVVQYVTDTVNHDKITIDGRNTIHGVGMIATITPATNTSYHIPRITVPTEDICSIGHVNIKYFTLVSEGIRSLSYQPLDLPNVEDSTSANDALWKASLLLRPKRSGWSGLMQMVQKGDHQGQFSLLYFPMIDMDPSDLSCVYSTLCYVSSHAKKHNVTPNI